jgi:nucleoside-diphosphate-sugar epimerase
MRKPAILITGANGEMGHGLITALHKKNNVNIVALDLNPLDVSISMYANEELIGNILDQGLIEQLNGEYEFDTIYHLAALLSTRAEFSPQAAHDVNVGGTLNLLNLAIEQGRSQGNAVKFFFPSSIAIYGLANLETKNNAGPIKEDSYQNPTTMYGCNKLYCEHLGNYYTNNYQRLGAEKQKSFIDFRSIRFPGIISSKTIPTAGTSDYIPEMLHAAAKGNSYNCFVREDTQIPFMTMPDAIQAITQLMSAPKENISRTVYNIRSFAPTAEKFRQKVLEFFPHAQIEFEVTEKRQKMVDSWPADTDDSIAKNDWNWKPAHDLDSGMKDYLIPDLKQMYKK